MRLDKFAKVVEKESQDQTAALSGIRRVRQKAKNAQSRLSWKFMKPSMNSRSTKKGSRKFTCL